jgi:dihydroflavonol-4-reductase
MKAFITGATGFVGSHLVDRLLEKGYDVFCLVRKTSNLQWLKDKNIHLVEGDLFSNDVLAATIKDMDYIFHVAGVVKSKDKAGFEKGNFLATKNLLELTLKNNPNIKKFIHISSGAVCGPNPDDKPMDEKYEPKPKTTYGITKKMAEDEVIKFKDKLPVVIIRPPAVFGPRDTEIFIYFKTFAGGLNSVIGFKEKYLSLIYVDDLVNGIILAAEKNTASGSIYFICSDKEYNWNEIGNTTSKLLGKKAIKLRIPHWLVYTVGAIAQSFSIFSKKAATLNLEKCFDITRKKWVFSNEKAKKELGFKEQFSLEESFGKTIDWYKEMKWLK